MADGELIICRPWTKCRCLHFILIRIHWLVGCVRDKLIHRRTDRASVHQKATTLGPLYREGLGSLHVRPLKSCPSLFFGVSVVVALRPHSVPRETVFSR